MKAYVYIKNFGGQEDCETLVQHINASSLWSAYYDEKQALVILPMKAHEIG